MDKIFLVTMLYDFYGELLTDKQRAVLERHYLDDLSLNEIGLEQGTTRQAVMDIVKRSEKILRHYENKLHLVERYIEQKEKLECAVDTLNEVIGRASELECSDRDKLTAVKKMLAEILD